MSVDIPVLSVYVHINNFTALMTSYDVLYDVFSICRYVVDLLDFGLLLFFFFFFFFSLAFFRARS